MSRALTALVAAIVATACIADQSVGDLPSPAVADAAPDPDTGATSACNLAIECPSPSSPDLATICGQLHDVRTQLPLVAASPLGAPCDPMNPSESGPCSVCLNAYTPASLVAGPGDALALDSELIELDDCGRYRMVDIAPPPDGNVALLAGNCNPVANQWAPTAVSIATSPEMLVDDQRMYATARATDRAWTQSASFPFGADTFVDRGAVLATFVHEGQPRPGVTLTINGRPVPLGTHYFADLTTIDTDRSDTGSTGSALAVGTDFVLHGGTGAEPFGCVWPSQMAASIPGVLFVQHKQAVSSPTGDQCHQPGISGNLR